MCTKCCCGWKCGTVAQTLGAPVDMPRHIAPRSYRLQKQYSAFLETMVMWLVGVCAVVGLGQLVALLGWSPAWRH